jgi:hypothetical protein
MLLPSSSKGCATLSSSLLHYIRGAPNTFPPNWFYSAPPPPFIWTLLLLLLDSPPHFTLWTSPSLICSPLADLAIIILCHIPTTTQYIYCFCALWCLMIMMT